MAARRIVPELRKQADLVVAVTHIGIGEDVRLAHNVAGIDLILGGHTHTTLPRGLREKAPDGKSSLICQTGEYLHNLGKVAVRMKPAAGGRGFVVDTMTAELIPLDATVKRDPHVTALMARLAEAAAQPASQPDRELVPRN